MSETKIPMAERDRRALLLEGIRLGLAAAAREAHECACRQEGTLRTVDVIRALDPADIIAAHEKEERGDWKPTVTESPDWTCRICGSSDVWYRVIDDDHDDRAYHCRGCDRRWIYEGPDA